MDGELHLDDVPIKLELDPNIGDFKGLASDTQEMDSDNQPEFVDRDSDSDYEPKKLDEKTRPKESSKFTSENFVTCNLCTKGYVNVTLLNKHVLEVHGSLSLQKKMRELVSCPLCDKKFTKKGIKDHINRHNPVRKHKCHLCPKSFVRPSGLQKHLDKHAGIRPFPCDICGQTFAQRSHVKSHMNVHSSTKPYQCDICDRRFKSAQGLNGHKMDHTNERPFECKYEGCEKSYKAAAALTSHEMIHTGERAFKCNVCTAEYRYKDSLMQHFVRHHPNDVLPTSISVVR